MEAVLERRIETPGPLRRAIEAADRPSVATWLKADGMEAERAEAVARRLKLPYHGDKSWSDATTAMWLRNRIQELFPDWFKGGGSPTYWRFGVPLHFFFIGIEETPDMLARLRNERKWAKDAKPARSRITDETLPLEPINRVAGWVGPHSESP